MSPIPVLGSISGVSARNAARLSVVAMRANTVLALAPVEADGTYCLTLPRAADHPDSPWALELAVLPSNTVGHPDRVPGLRRATIACDSLREASAVEAPELVLDDTMLAAWSIFWREPQRMRPSFRAAAHLPAGSHARVNTAMAWAR